MLGRLEMYRCDGCGEIFEENELTELEFFQGVPMQSLCSRCLGMIFVKGGTKNDNITRFRH